MATLSMNRIIHAAVRRDVARTERALRALPEGDRARARQLQRAWHNLVRELTHHHEAEDDLVWPFLAARGVGADLLTAMEDEHAAMKGALTEASRAIDAAAAEPTAAAVRRAADVVAHTGTVIDAHLAHEEGDVEPLLERLEDDSEWTAVAKRLRPSSIVDAANSLAWMQDGAGARERTALRTHVPGPVVTVLTAVLGRRYRRDVAPVWRATA